MNSANSGAPISLQLHFNSNPNASLPKSVQTFIEQKNTLHIKPNGESSTVANYFLALLIMDQRESLDDIYGDSGNALNAVFQHLSLAM